MKISIEKIILNRFRVRDKLDPEHLKAIEASLKMDGQWDPLMVRKNETGLYELISGQYRLQAAQALGWKEIEATVKDLSEEEAMILALKTNIMRRSMAEMEEARALKGMMDKFEWSQRVAATHLGVSQTWVGNRLALVLNIIDEVQEALAEDRISMEHAVLISRLSVTIEGEVVPDVEKQRMFLQAILKEGLSRDEARKVLKWIQNDAIYTVGYAGKDIDGFSKSLKDQGIDLLVDIRESGESRYKPEFNESILAREMKKAGIGYERKPELGVILDVRTPYIEGWLDDECFERWYEWSVQGRKKGGKTHDLVPELVKAFKEAGKVSLMCEEAHPEPRGKQEHYCHRHFLAGMLLDYRDPDEPLLKFDRRVDF